MMPVSPSNPRRGRKPKRVSKPKTRKPARGPRLKAAAAPEPVPPHALNPQRVQRARHPWRSFSIVFGAALLLVGGFWFISSSGMVANRFRPDLERELSKTLNRPVKIDRLEGGVFDRVVLRKVVIGAPASDASSLDITIERVVVRYSLWDILVKKKSLAESLREIQLIRPLIRFERDGNGHWHSPNLMSWTPADDSDSPNVPPIKISLVQGEMRFSAGSQSFSLRQLRGLLNLADPTHAPLYLYGRTGPQRRAHVKVSGDLDLTQKQFHLGLSAEHLRLRPLERVLQFSPFFEVTGGEASLTLQVNSHPAQPSDLIPGVDLKGKVILDDCELKTSAVQTPIRGVFGVVLLDNQKLSLKNLQAILGKTVWQAKGSLEHLRQPKLFIKVQSNHLKLGDLVESFPRLGQLNTSGEGSAVILIQGVLPDLSATATVRLGSGKIGQMPIRRFESIFRYAGGEMRLLMAKAFVAHGQAEGRGKIVFSDKPGASPVLDFALQAQSLDMSDLGSLFQFKNIKGRADAQISLNGNFSHPALQGVVFSPSLSLARTEFTNFRGIVQYDPQAVTLTAQARLGALNDLALTLQMNREGEGWRIRPFSLQQKGEAWLRAEGTLGVSLPRQLDLAVQGRNLPLAQLPFWPASLRHLDGRFNLLGHCSGPWDNPEAQFRFSSPRLIRNYARGLDLAGEAELSQKRVNIRALNLDGHAVSVQGALDLDSREILHGSVKLERASLKNIMALAGKAPSSSWQGRLQGAVQIAGPFREVATRGDLVLDSLSGTWGEARSGKLSFATRGANLQVKHFELAQDHGRLAASLETRVSNRGFFRGNAHLDRFELARHVWSGDLKIEGAPGGTRTAEYTLNVAMTRAMADGKPMPDAAGQCVWQVKNNQVLINTLRWGDELSLSGQIGWAQALNFRLQALLDKSRLKTLRELGRQGAKPLKEPLSGLVRCEGTLEKIRADFHIMQGSGEINGTAQWAGAQGNTRAEFQTALRLTDVQVQNLADLFAVPKKTDWPETKVTGSLNYAPSAGPLPMTSGNLACEGFRYGLLELSSLKVIWETQGGKLLLKQLDALQVKPDGFLKIAGGEWQARPDGTNAFNLNLEADNFYFFFKRFHGHFRLKGLVPSLDPFALTMNLASDDFKLDDHDYGDFRSDIQYQDDDLKFQSPAGLPYKVVGHARLLPGGSVDFKRLEIFNGAQRKISAAGLIDNTGEGHSDFLVNVYHVPAKVIAESFGWPQPWTGLAKGSVHYTDPGNITHVKIKVRVEDGSVIGIPFDSFSGTVTIDHNWLYFLPSEDEPPVAEPALAGGCLLRRNGKYTMVMKGRLPLPQTPAAEQAMRGEQIDLRIVMPEGDLSFLVMIPYLEAASGRSSLDLSVHGTMDYPSLSGAATITDGVIEPKFYTPKLDHVQADLKFDNNKTYIQKLEARAGEGTLTVKAGPAYPWAMMFRLMIPHELNLVLESSHGRLRLDTTRDFEFISAWMNGRLTLGGTLENVVLGGNLEFSDGNFTYPPKSLTPFSQEMKSGSIQCDSLKLEGKNNFWFTNDMVRAQIKPDNSVVFKGGKNDFSGEGRVSLSKGFFTYLDANFSLDSSRDSALTFQGREAPVLHAVASTVVRDVQIKDEGKLRQVTIYLTVHGSLGSLKLDLSSEPVMTQAQIMSLLTLGEDFSSWTKEQIDEKVQTAGARVLGRWAGSLIGQQIKTRLQKIAPIDVVDIRLGGVEKVAGSIVSGSGNSTVAGNTGGSETTGMSLLQNTQIGLGKYLTDDLYFNYRATLKDRSAERGGGLAWQSLLGLEYNLDSSRKLKVSKDFDVDSGQELFVGIEGRTEFKNWSPSAAESDTATAKSQVRKTPTPVKK